MVKTDDIRQLARIISVDLGPMIILTSLSKDKDYYNFMKIINRKNSSEELIEKLTNIRNEIDRLIQVETEFLRNFTKEK